MRKIFDPKISGVRDTVRDVRETSHKIGSAAESQATLNIALTAVCVTALLVAMLLAQDLRGREARGGR
jgi:hypothetical protein